MDLINAVKNMNSYLVAELLQREDIDVNFRIMRDIQR